MGKYIIFFLALGLMAVESIAVRPLEKVFSRHESMRGETHISTTFAKKRLLKKKFNDLFLNIGQDLGRIVKPACSMPFGSSNFMSQVPFASQVIVDNFQEATPLSYFEKGKYRVRGQEEIRDCLDLVRGSPSCCSFDSASFQARYSGVHAEPVIYVGRRSAYIDPKANPILRVDFRWSNACLKEGGVQFKQLTGRINDPIPGVDAQPYFYKNNGPNACFVIQPIQYNLCDKLGIGQRIKLSGAFLVLICEHLMPSDDRRCSKTYNVMKYSARDCIVWNELKMRAFRMNDDGLSVQCNAVVSPPAECTFHVSNRNAIIRPCGTMLLRCFHGRSGKLKVFGFDMNTLQLVKEFPELEHEVTDDLICLDNAEIVMLFSTKFSTELFNKSTLVIQSFVPE